MDSRYDKYSLKRLINELSERFSGIAEIYLFGSRRHRTRSTRSDLDLLVRASQDVKPEDVRDFALQECPVLDFFFMDRGIATSCANGSTVKGRSNRDLIYRLDAVRIWDKRRGFTDVDVDWEFKVIKGLDPLMTTTISVSPLPSKSMAVATTAPEEREAARRSRWKDVGTHPLTIIASTALIVVAATFAVIRQTRIIPLEQDITRIQKRLDTITTTNMAQKKESANNRPELIDGALGESPKAHP